jgi:hypothetical protein
VVTTLVCFLHFAHEAAGALGARHSPRPRLGERYMRNSGTSRRGIAELRLESGARLIRADLFEMRSDCHSR